MGQPTDQRQDRRPEPRSNPLAPTTLGLPAGLVSDVATVAESLDHLDGMGVNLLAPLTRIEFIPDGYRLAFRAVLFPMDGSWITIGGKRTNGTWYETDGGGLALHKAPLRQIAAAAGLSWLTEDLSRDVNRWTVRAVGRLRTMDGAWRSVSATKDLDLRDNGPIVPTWNAEAQRRNRDASKRILKAREYGNRMAESKAVNALIRSALGVRVNYTRDQAGRPFVFPLLVWTPETDAARQLQAAVELGVVSQVYGGPTSSTGPAYSAGQVLEVAATEPPPSNRALTDKSPAPRRAPKAEPAKQRPPPPRRDAPARQEDPWPPSPPDSVYNDPDW